MSQSIYQRITSTLIEQIESADPAAWICPWHRPHGGIPANAVTGRRYRGVNILSLWCSAQRAGFSGNGWASYKQWRAGGAQVRQGERGTLVIYYGEKVASHHDESEDSANPAGPSPKFVLRTSVVFNRDQVDGLPATPTSDMTHDPQAADFDTFASRTGATIRHGFADAAYVSGRDEIHMPARECFTTGDGYSATLAHELIHWTGAPHRIGRDLSGRFGTRTYAAEELVAEIGAAFVLASLGISPEPHPNHAAYMAAWLELVRDDPRAIVVAASQASLAADWLAAKAGSTEPR